MNYSQPDSPSWLPVSRHPWVELCVLPATSQPQRGQEWPIPRKSTIPHGSGRSSVGWHLFGAITSRDRITYRRGQNHSGAVRITQNHLPPPPMLVWWGSQHAWHSGAVVRGAQLQPTFLSARFSARAENRAEILSASTSQSRFY